MAMIPFIKIRYKNGEEDTISILFVLGSISRYENGIKYCYIVSDETVQVISTDEELKKMGITFK